MKKPYLIVAVLMLLTIAIMIIGFREPAAQAPATPNTYLLLVSDDTGAFLMQLKRGMDDAAARLRVKWTAQVLAPGDMPVVSGQNGAVVYLDAAEDWLDSLSLPVVVAGRSLPNRVCVFSQAPAETLPVSDADAPLSQLVSALEKGLINAFYAQDPYAIGYLALKTLHEGGGSQAVPLTRISIDNLYLKENIKRVFPLLQ